MKKDLVSIVILTKNAGCTFEQTLHAVYNQDVENPFEVIVVDSGSNDETLDITRKYKIKLFEIKPDDFNFGLTRDYAFSLADGEFIVTISQDVIPCDRFWLRNIVSPFYENDRLVAVQGSTRIQENADVFYWEKKGIFYFTSESKKWIKKHNCGLSFVNCAIRRDFWQHHRIGFVSFSEDKYFQKLIHDAGMEVFFEKEAVCYHGHQYTLKSLVRRLKNEGMGWRYAGVKYGIMDCLHDIYNNKWLLRKGIGLLIRGDLHTIQELIFPVLRPVCIYYGNSRSNVVV